MKNKDLTIKVYKKLSTMYPKQIDILKALMTINGLEQGLIDFYGYVASGNFNYSLDDIWEEIKGE